MNRHVARMRQIRNVYKISVGKFERESTLGVHRRKLEDNTKTDLREKLFYVVVFIWLAQNKVQWRILLNTVMKLFS